MLEALEAGLSPRLRGNHRGGFLASYQVRSIPAPAGEPSGPPASSCRHRVYPRACGGTTAASESMLSARGLSPRLRGNQVRRVLRDDGTGSIPAPAGEPPLSASWVGSHRVYPRACGGTQLALCLRPALDGLSPRLRGNLMPVRRHLRSLRSIPAPAGEPSPSLRAYPGIRVYPRACGGTIRVDHRATDIDGLSPRLRGNQLRLSRRTEHHRSIPAPAGEPRRGAHR